MTGEASDVEICNLAMIRLGAETSTSLSQNSRTPAVRREFELARDPIAQARLELRPRKSRLAADTTRRRSGSAISTRCRPISLRLHPVSRDDWQIEALYPDGHGAPLDVTYVKRVTDTSLFDALFDDALLGALLPISPKIYAKQHQEGGCQGGYKETIRSPSGERHRSVSAERRRFVGRGEVVTAMPRGGCRPGSGRPNALSTRRQRNCIVFWRRRRALTVREAGRGVRNFTA